MSKSTVRLWQIGGTPKAYLFSRRPRERDSNPKDAVWIPRSQIECITKFPEDTFGWRECEVTLPDWLVDKHGL